MFERCVWLLLLLVVVHSVENAHTQGTKPRSRGISTRVQLHSGATITRRPTRPSTMRRLHSASRQCQSTQFSNVVMPLVETHHQLSVTDICRLAATCKTLKLTVADRSVWCILLRRRWPSTEVLGSTALIENPKGLYRRLHTIKIGYVKETPIEPPRCKAEDFVLLLDLTLNGEMRWSVAVSGAELEELFTEGHVSVNAGTAHSVSTGAARPTFAHTAGMVPFSEETGDSLASWGQGSGIPNHGYVCKAHLLRKSDQSIICLINEDKTKEQSHHGLYPIHSTGKHWQQLPPKGDQPDLAEHLSMHFEDTTERGLPIGDRSAFVHFPEMRVLAFEVAPAILLPRSPVTYAYNDIMESVEEATVEEWRRAMDADDSWWSTPAGCAAYDAYCDTVLNWQGLTERQRAEAVRKAEQQYGRGDYKSAELRLDAFTLTFKCICDVTETVTSIYGSTTRTESTPWHARRGRGNRVIADDLKILHFIDGVQWDYFDPTNVRLA